MTAPVHVSLTEAANALNYAAGLINDQAAAGGQMPLETAVAYAQAHATVALADAITAALTRTAVSPLVVPPGVSLT